MYEDGYSKPARFLLDSWDLGSVPTLTIPVQTWGILEGAWGAASSSDSEPYKLELTLNDVPVWGWYWSTGFEIPQVIPLPPGGLNIPMYPGDVLRAITLGGPTTQARMCAWGRWLGVSHYPGPQAV